MWNGYTFWNQWLRGGETHVFLPFAKEEFIETSVRRVGGNWVSGLSEYWIMQPPCIMLLMMVYGDDTLFNLL